LRNLHFPNESAAYRAARNELLEAETKLRQRIEQVAAMRRRLPLGGAAKEDYVFEEGETMLSGHPVARRVRLSELFGEHDSLVIYNFMFGPEMEHPYPACASILDSLDGATQHINQRTNLVIVARSPVARIRQLALSRGWRRLRFLSSSQNSYNRDYHGEAADGSQLPMLNVFVRRNGRVHHFTGSEMLFGPRESGQGPRHVDLIWPLWNVLDLTPEGRGKDWTPQLSYMD
jgi:predicted dithiol-disulfide oxidoreductase (DUF899 family)